MKRLLSIFTGKHQPDRDALSAYLDGELAPEAASKLEAHVADCETCTSTLAGMREVRTMLRALPEAEAPRSFRLRQSDVEAPARRGLPAPPSGLMRAMPVLSGTAAVVFAIAVGIDVSGSGGRSDNGSAGLAMSRESTTQNYDIEDGRFSPGDAGGGADGESAPEGPAPNAGATAAEETPVDPQAARASDDDEGAEDAQPDASDSAGGGMNDMPATDPTAEFEATSVADEDDDGNNLTLRIVQIASAAVAIAAAGVALRMWRKRGEGLA